MTVYFLWLTLTEILNLGLSTLNFWRSWFLRFGCWCHLSSQAVQSCLLSQRPHINMATDWPQMSHTGNKMENIHEHFNFSPNFILPSYIEGSENKLFTELIHLESRMKAIWNTYFSCYNCSLVAKSLSIQKVLGIMLLYYLCRCRYLELTYAGLRGFHFTGACSLSTSFVRLRMLKKKITIKYNHQRFR